MPYLNVHLDYFDHPKTKRLVRLLGKGSEALPIRLWAYCGKYHAEDGRLTGYSTQEIEATCAWWGTSGEMVDAMIGVGFLDVDGDTLVVHEWDEHEGHIVAYRERAKTAANAKWEQYREKSSKDPPSNASSSASSITTSNATLGSELEFIELISEELKTPAFLEAWGDWVQQRKERKPKITPTAAKQQLAKLSGWGAARAVAALKHSIAGNYQGIFEEHRGTNGTPRETQAQRNQRQFKERRQREDAQ